MALNITLNKDVYIHIYIYTKRAIGGDRTIATKLKILKASLTENTTINMDGSMNVGKR